MNYRFVCPSCGKTFTLSMPVSEYTASGHLCPCGAELKRDVKDFATSYAVKCDGFYSDYPSK